MELFVAFATTAFGAAIITSSVVIVLVFLDSAITGRQYPEGTGVGIIGLSLIVGLIVAAAIFGSLFFTGEAVLADVLHVWMLPQ